MSSERFDFTIYGTSSQTDAQRRNVRADILDFNGNFEKIEENGALLEDLPLIKVKTIAVADWSTINDANEGTIYQVRIEDEDIKEEPYTIDVLFRDLSVIQAPIVPKAESQAAGSIILQTAIKPTTALTYNLIIGKGVVNND